MAYLNGKKVVFSPHIHGIANDGVNVRIEIAQEAQLAGNYLRVFGTTVNEDDTSLEYYRNDRMRDNVTLKLAKNTILTLQIQGSIEPSAAQQYLIPTVEETNFCVYKISNNTPENGVILFIAS